MGQSKRSAKIRIGGFEAKRFLGEEVKGEKRKRGNEKRNYITNLKIFLIQPTEETPCTIVEWQVLVSRLSVLYLKVIKSVSSPWFHGLDTDLIRTWSLVGIEKVWTLPSTGDLYSVQFTTASICEPGYIQSLLFRSFGAEARVNVQFVD